ncbi:MAG: hypothetical protein K2K54_09900 [Lachnospiraceae bacterium]|nr:hypothetical protein [Lachnospiraceae bacterium]
MGQERRYSGETNKETISGRNHFCIIGDSMVELVMAKSGMNPKTLQKIMEHSDIDVTLNTYTYLDFEDIQKEMKQVCNSEL